MPSVDSVVLVPVKAFTAAKARLAGVLSPGQRADLARWSAARVVAAAGELPVHVACDDDEVAEWATRHGAGIEWHPGVGLNEAVRRSVASLAGQGAARVVVAHGDLPRAHGLARLAQLAPAGGALLVPDHVGDGTNVTVVPASAAFPFAYGPGSFRRHVSLAIAARLPLTVHRDALLALDLDVPTDLTHPLVQEVLPEWLPTNLANPHPNPA